MKRAGKIIIAASALALVAVAADNTLGTWKYNAAKSHPAEGGRPYISLIITREGVGGGVKQTVQEVNASGKTHHGDFTAAYGGTSVVVHGDLAFDTVEEKQIDVNTVSQEIAEQGGKLRATRRYSVSGDGKTMTVTTSGTGRDGKAFTQVSVFDRQ
jgi:hypothetical protein